MKSKLVMRWFISLFFLCYSALSIASFEDIRYRTIIYFYPQENASSIPTSDLIPDGFSKLKKLPDTVDKPYVVLNHMTDFSETYPVPGSSYLAYFGRGLTSQQTEQIQSSNKALMVDIAVPVQSAFESNKKLNNWMFELASKYDATIWDSETRELFSANAWKVKRMDSWSEFLPVIKDNIVIHSYEDNGSTRAITLGMAKFGLPDVVVNDFAWSYSDNIGRLVNLTTQLLAENQKIADQKLNIDISKLKESHYKEALLDSLYENAKGQAVIGIGKAKWEEGDPYNELIELVFDDAEGETLSEKHESFLTSVFGRYDPLLQVKHNEEILAASKRAKAHLNQLRTSFNAGLEPGEYIQVKAPFLTTDGGNEWMWVEVVKWGNQTIEGLLRNEPYNVPELNRGSKVTVNQSDVFDYIHTFPDGTSKGDETGDLIMKYKY